MESLLSKEKLLLFAILVFPGIVSMSVYRLIFAAKPIDWKSAIIEGLFYSGVNFAICSPLIAIMDALRHQHPIIASLFFPVIFLIGPIIWPCVILKLFRCDWVVRHLQLPFPTGWDFFFHKRIQCFVLITLNNGGCVGGFFGPGSYAGSFPNEGDIYIQHVYQIDDSLSFGEAVDGSLGMWIRKDEYSVIEFFEVPV